ncbi:MAG TPA: recombinase family protein [Galbitalea sp.]|nr:recombinase family protein [Galbitalea sp.]
MSQSVERRDIELGRLSAKSIYNLCMEQNTEGSRVAIYARLSVDRDGSKVGIDTQLIDARELARERGWNIVDEYVDRNLTAADKLVKRPEYDRLVADYGIGSFTALICWDLDRLTRQPRQLEDWIDAAQDKHLVIVTANGEADLSTDAGRLFARIKATVAKSEAERASARQKRNKAYRRDNGLFHGGQAPFGYKVADKSLVAEPTEVALVQEAAHRLLNDRESMHSIITDWNRLVDDDSNVVVHPTRSGKHWRQSNLRAILTNRSLLGETKSRVVGWQPILDKRTFDRLQVLFGDPSRKTTHSPGVKGGKYTMGGGLSVCRRCGKPLTSQLRGGTRDTSLLCNKQVHGPDMKNHPQLDRDSTNAEQRRKVTRPRIDHDSLEAFVFNEAMSMLKDTKRFRDRMAERSPDTNNKIDELEAERERLRLERERAGRAFVAGIMGELEAKREVDRVDASIQALDASIHELLGRPVLASALESRVDWDKLSPARRRAFLGLLIDGVIVDGWPEGITRNPGKFRAETDHERAARADALRQKALRERVLIVWKWGI